MKTENVFTTRRIALGAMVSVLILAGVNFWLAIASAAGVGVLWSIAELVVEEIQGRRRLREEGNHDSG